MPQPRIIVLEGPAAEEAAGALSRRIAETKAELERRGAKSYEAAVLLPDGTAVSDVTGDEAQG